MNQIKEIRLTSTVRLEIVRALKNIPFLHLEGNGAFVWLFMTKLLVLPNGLGFQKKMKILFFSHDDVTNPFLIVLYYCTIYSQFTNAS